LNRRALDVCPVLPRRIESVLKTTASEFLPHFSSRGQVVVWHFERKTFMQIRPSRPEDAIEVHALHIAAFEQESEARLVEALNQQATDLVSIVAHDGIHIVGHAVFSPVTLSSDAELRLAGLGPIAVSPGHQRRGIGGTLIRDGLAECRRLGFAAVVVLGHPSYYPRFGFAPASGFGIRSEYKVPDDVFMALELQTGSLAGRSGVVRYHPAFADLGC
jgi:putative acetyltransferase